MSSITIMTGSLAIQYLHESVQRGYLGRDRTTARPLRKKRKIFVKVKDQSSQHHGYKRAGQVSVWTYSQPVVQPTRGFAAIYPLHSIAPTRQSVMLVKVTYIGQVMSRRLLIQYLTEKKSNAM